jgi:16S rRNA (cytosine1402-N4)-methyltransferase
MNYQHISVLTQAVLDNLQIKDGGHYLDCTCGGGGHSLAILQGGKDIWLTAIDQDQEALTATKNRLVNYQERVHLWHGNFSEFRPIEGQLFDGIIADLGVSSHQIDRPERGFSFRHSAPLDMRMNARQSLTCAHIINHWSEVDLANLIYEYGEERYSRRIARQIVQSRPLSTTTELAELIWQAVPSSYRHGAIHPATRTFQALRIAVNGELEHLRKWLERAPNWLKSQGRIAIISFHSLEDRIIKYELRQDNRLRVITKKPIVPDISEITANPRSRSAKLRVAERITVHSG